MPFLSPGHLGGIIVLTLIVLIIWGPGKLPDVGAGLGRSIREFRKATSETKSDIATALAIGPTKEESAGAVQQPSDKEQGRSE